MRGVSRKPTPFVCEDDRSLPSNEQTVFWLTCKNNEDTNKTLRRYARAAKDGRDGNREYDDRLLTVADKEEFLTVCSKVENFAFSEQYYERRPQVAQKADDNGFIDMIDDPDLLGDLVTDLPPDVLSEIFAAVNNPVKLDRGAKKNSN
tara:strand:- start:2111 stop:2554 length:444 start_codon:yes stop_codon:yes gene_type:complete